MKVQIIGMGVVGKALGHVLAYSHEVVGYDVAEVECDDLEIICHVCDDADAYVICVQTPLDGSQVDITPLIGAVEMVNTSAPPGALISIESTLTPSMILDCAIAAREDLLIGHSPERYNHGDDILTETKLYAGRCKDASVRMSKLYCDAFELYLCSSLESCALAKCMENVQRDVNIALMNEIYNGCQVAGVDFNDALIAAKTKRNFAGFNPGLVGGACIPKDAEMLADYFSDCGYITTVMDEARIINDMCVLKAEARINSVLTDIDGKSVLFIGRGYKMRSDDETGSKILLLSEAIAKRGYTVQHDGERAVSGADIEKYDLIVLQTGSQKAKAERMRDYGMENPTACRIMWLFE